MPLRAMMWWDGMGGGGGDSASGSAGGSNALTRQSTNPQIQPKRGRGPNKKPTKKQEQQALNQMHKQVLGRRSTRKPHSLLSGAGVPYYPNLTLIVTFGTTRHGARCSWLRVLHGTCKWRQCASRYEGQRTALHHIESC